MLVCRNCKKIIMYSINGYCEECITPERASEQNEQADVLESVKKEKSLPTDVDRLFDWCAVTTRR